MRFFMPNFYFYIKLDADKFNSLKTTDILAIFALILSIVVFIVSLVYTLKNLSKFKYIFIEPYFAKHFYNFQNDISLMIINKSNSPFSIISVHINNKIINNFPVYLKANETKIIPLEYKIEDKSQILNIEVFTNFKKFKFKAKPYKHIKPKCLI